jgi:hypothetical protein
MNVAIGLFISITISSGMLALIGMLMTVICYNFNISLGKTAFCITTITSLTLCGTSFSIAVGLHIYTVFCKYLW